MQESQTNVCDSIGAIQYDRDKSIVQPYTYHQELYDACALKESQNQPKQFKESKYEAIRKLFCRNMSQLVMESDKSTWHQPSLFENKQRLNFFDRDKRVISKVDIAKHVVNSHTIIAAPMAKAPSASSQFFKYFKANPNPKSNWAALDIDVDHTKGINTDCTEIALVIQLRMIEELTGLKIYYCRSTGGNGFHLWFFSKKRLSFKLLKNAALTVEAMLPFEVDKLYPTGSQGITMPFAEHRPVKDIEGKRIEHPEQFKFLDAAVFESLPTVEDKEPEPIPVQEKIFNHPYSCKFSESTKHQLKSILGLSDYLNKLSELFPDAGQRQDFIFKASADLYYFGVSEVEAIQYLINLCKENHDVAELYKRETAIRKTYAKASKGLTVLGFKGHNNSTDRFKIIAYSALTKIGSSLRPSTALARVFTALYLNRLNDADLGDFSERLLSELTGIADRECIRKCLKELIALGVLERISNKLNSYHYNLTVVGKGRVLSYLIDVETVPSLEDKQRLEVRKARHARERGLWAIFLESRYTFTLEDILKPLEDNSERQNSVPVDDFHDDWHKLEPTRFILPKLQSSVPPNTADQTHKTILNSTTGSASHAAG